MMNRTFWSHCCSTLVCNLSRRQINGLRTLGRQYNNQNTVLGSPSYWFCGILDGLHGVVTGHVITHHLHPFPYTIEVFQGSHSPLGSGVSQAPELKWNEDHCLLLYAFKAMVCSQHHAESQCLGRIDSSRLGSLWVHNAKT